MSKSAETSRPVKPATGKPGPAKPGQAPVKEIGGPPGPEPTRYGDWEIKGRVSDF
jgi:homeobox protein ESX1